MPVEVVSALLFTLAIGLLILIYGPLKQNLKWSTISVFTPLIIWLVLAIIIYSIETSAP